MRKCTVRTIDNFDIAQIAKSGQCFRLNEHPEKEHAWQLVAFGRYLEIEQQPGSSEVKFSCTQEEFEAVWEGYFDIENGTDYKKIIEQIDKEDKYLKAAADAGKGIRILQQEPWEMLISFTISQNNNIPRIKKSIETLCTVYGEPHVTEEGKHWYDFPTPDKLAKIENLANMGLGYRDKYIQKMSENVMNGSISLEAIERMADVEAKNYLKSIYGIGEKVADCILLFGYHRIDNVPKDTWINKVIKEHYNGKFPAERYKGYAGIIQQYIFNYATNGEKKDA